MTSDIIIIGAGIIGISTALALQDAGFRDILVLERAMHAPKASDVNAGAFAFTDIEPLATPGIMRKAPKWLLDPLGPLSVPPSYALKIAPWMLRFWRASWRDRYDASVAAQGQLMGLARAALERQITATKGESLIQREGQLLLFEGEAEYRASLPSRAQRRAHGIRFELLESPGAIAEIQPGLAPRFTHAGFTPDWMNTRDPARWLAHLTAQFHARGGRIEVAQVNALERRGTEIALHCGSDIRILGKKLVVAAGAWSHQLAKTLGDRIPLETERGYNTTLPQGAFDLRTHLTFGGHGFVVSKINGGVRVGGAAELGGLHLAPNFKRADILLSKAAQFLPGLKTSGGSQWMGFRPSLPDSLPVIGPSPRDRRVVYAFGHGHLGLTQSAGTAELVAALVSGKVPSIEMQAFSAARF
jgi:D-amino-acid dehydrogenase